MELILVVRQLWRRRLLVLLGAALAAAAAFALGPSPTAPRGYAAARVLLDTSRSQMVTDAPVGAETLPWRATLAATLLGTDASRKLIAGKVGITQKDLTVSNLELAAPTDPASLPKSAVSSAYSTSQPYSLTLHTDGVVPLVSIAADAPTEQGAQRLALAAIETLEANSETAATKDLLGVRVETTTPIDSVSIPGGKGRKRMVAAAVVLFGMWISGLVLIPAVIGAVRTVARAGDVAGAR